MNDTIASEVTVEPLVCSRCGQLLRASRVTTNPDKNRKRALVICDECSASGWKAVSYQDGFGVMLAKGTPRPTD